MDNQHKKITGYRDLSAEEIAMMNAVKDLAKKVGDLVESLETVPNLDQRWVAEGKMNLQVGFMELVRAVAQPTTF